MSLFTQLFIQPKGFDMVHWRQFSVWVKGSLTLCLLALTSACITPVASDLRAALAGLESW